MFKSVASIFILFISLHHVANSSKAHSVSKRQSLTTPQLTCISEYTDERITSSSSPCTDIVVYLSLLYGSTNPLLAISQRLSVFPEFCRPECGQVITDAWTSCGVYDEIESLADLLTGLCGSHAGSTCYSMYHELARSLQGALNCIGEPSCLSNCSSSDALARIQTHGCCLDVAFDFVMNQDEINDLFSSCEVTRPGRCSNSPLSTGGSSGSHVTTLLSVVSVCIAAVFMM